MFAMALQQAGHLLRGWLLCPEECSNRNIDLKEEPSLT
jgi:hypothetical protein